MMSDASIFLGFSSKGISDTEAAAMATSPISILETRPFFSIGDPFSSERSPRTPHPWENADSKAIGLGIVDADQSLKPDSRIVLFGSQLKIQIPSVNSPCFPIEFGVKNKASQLSLLSPALISPISEAPSPGVFTGCLSASEVEMSEDYTCVIMHGPNPKTTHIFHNCILESCGDGFTPKRLSAEQFRCPPDDFLNFCFACKKSLGQGKDIFMYRGEKAFCSSECRYREILYDEGTQKTSSNTSANF